MYLTSRGVPARFSIFTITCTPFKSSNTRSAGMESTRIHSRVSMTTEARGITVVLGSGVADAPDLGEVGVLEEGVDVDSI